MKLRPHMRRTLLAERASRRAQWDQSLGGAALSSSPAADPGVGGSYLNSPHSGPNSDLGEMVGSPAFLPPRVLGEPHGRMNRELLAGANVVTWWVGHNLLRFSVSEGFCQPCRPPPRGPGPPHTPGTAPPTSAARRLPPAQGNKTYFLRTAISECVLWD